MTPVSEDEDNVLRAFTAPKNRPLVGPLQVMTLLTFGVLKFTNRKSGTLHCFQCFRYKGMLL